VTVKEFLYVAAAVVAKFGYVSGAAAKKYLEASGGERGIRSTADRTWLQFFASQETREKFPEDFVEVGEADFAMAAAAKDWALSRPADSDYAYNLGIVLRKELCERRDGGFAASAIGSYQKHLGILAERAKAREGMKASEFFGEVGKRAEFQLTVMGEHHFAGDFGPERVLYRMQDTAGNIAVWWTSGAPLEVGKTYRLKATVKKHDLYKGEVKQTVLQRCVDEDAAEEARKAAKVEKAKQKALEAERAAKVKALTEARPGHAWEFVTYPYSPNWQKYGCSVCFQCEDDAPAPCKAPAAAVNQNAEVAA
jgi:hypothetical protein